jgi:hypothetical protein
VAKRKGDRDHLRPSPAWYAIKVANQLPEQVVREQFPDDQLQQCARPGEILRARGEQPHRTRTVFLAPSLGIELLLRASSLFEVGVDVDDDVTDLAHSQTSTNHGTYADVACRQFAEGLGRPRPTVCE